MSQVPIQDVQLDEAVQRADRLLVTSLQRQEGDRRSRRAFLRGLVTGAIVPSVALVVAWLCPRSSQITVPAVAPAQTAAPASRPDSAVEVAGILNREGWARWQRQEYDGAADAFDRAVTADPKLTAAWNGLGWSRFNGGKPDAAVSAFEHVLKLEPDHPAALNGLGQIRFAQNKLDDAERYLLKAAPRAPAAQWGLTKVYLLKGQWADAKKYARMIVQTTPAGPDQDDAKAMLTAAESGALPDDLRQKIAPQG